MTPESRQDLADFKDEIDETATRRYISGQKEHGGLLTDMGLLQAIDNLEAELVDGLAYLHVIKKHIYKVKEEK